MGLAGKNRLCNFLHKIRIQAIISKDYFNKAVELEVACVMRVNLWFNRGNVIGRPTVVTHVA